ncbi:MAG: hypothetical protein M0P01_15500 [Treponema sp.]|nr:hypothetical protein [Treponema sp.]
MSIDVKKITIIAVVLILLVSCSSAPKRPMLVTATADKAETLYKTANSELAAGMTENAGNHLDQAYTLALSIDNTDLLCKIMLSCITKELQTQDGSPAGTGSIPPVSTGTQGTGPGIIHIGGNADGLLKAARKAASRSADREKLEAVCSLYEARILLSKITPDDTADKITAVHALLDAQKTILKNEPYYLAYLYVTNGDAYLSAGNYAEAALCFETAADIHTKNRYLQETGFDWYSAARAYSHAGNKSTALTAIYKALAYDRDAENTAAIGADYYAAALILTKETYSNTEKEQALESAYRASEIYQAGGFYELAKKSFELAKKIKAE